MKASAEPEGSTDRRLARDQDGKAQRSDEDARQPAIQEEQRTELVSPTQSRVAKIKSNVSARSYAGGDGYTYFECDEEAQTQENGERDAEKEFEVQFDGSTDPMNPRGKAKWRKWPIVIILSMSSTCVTCVSSIYTVTYDQLEPELGITQEVATLGLSLFVVGLGVGPMFLAPLSEFYGRRPIYVYSLICFLIWLIPCAVADHVATMLVGRFFSGVAGSAFLSVAGGTVGDMFAGTELSAPMMVYTASPFIGPEVGPMIGGFIAQYTTWRWTFYLMMIWTGVQLALVFFFVPETYHPAVLRQKARKLRKETGNDALFAPIEKTDKSITKTVLWSCIRPFQLLFFEPMCLNLCLLSALLLGIIYLFFGAFALIFEDVYGFQLWGVGLSFTGLLIGMIVGVSSDPLWNRNYIRLIRRREAEGGEPGGTEPEFRLPVTVAGAALIPIGLFGFAWTTYPSVHWIVPIIFSAIFGLGTIWIYSGVFTFLVQSYPLYAASALAANSVARSTLAAAFPLFGIQMYETLGYHWASSLLGFLALAMSPFPYIFYRYGKTIRSKSRYASA